MAPRKASANALLRQRSRERILHHALRLFARHGYAGTSVRAIADSAGMAVGLLYNYFPSKAAVLDALFQQSMVEVQRSFAVAEREGDPVQRVAAVVRAAADITRANQVFWRLSYGVRMQSAVTAGLGRKLQGWTGTIRATLRGYLADAGATDPDVEAAALFALVDGMCQHFILQPTTYPLDDVVEHVCRTYVGRFSAGEQHGRT